MNNAKFITAHFLAVILVLVLLVNILFSGSIVALASVSGWQNGSTINPRWDTDFTSDTFKKSLQNLKATNANYVTLVIPYYQSNIYSTDIQKGWNTPSDDTLISAINYAHSIGLQVMLKPHLDSYDGQWRANINPGDRNSWYANYTAMITHYAQIAQQTGVEELCIGSELISMAASTSNSDNTQRWQNMIGQIRNIYSGKLTYSANWGGSGFPDEKNHIDFWGSLDYIGISAYFNLNTDGSVNSLKNAWDGWNTGDIKPLSDRFGGKPVLFTEVGYKSCTGAHYQPWNSSLGCGADQTEQANDYEALFSYWNNQPFMAGVQLWDWSSDPNAGGAGNTDYTPQNKQAQIVMTNWFGNAPAPTGTPAPSSAVFNSSASTNPISPPVNQSVVISASVKDQNIAANNMIVDVEIYRGGTQVKQNIFDGQSFTAGETKTYSVNYTPDVAGAYTVKIGIFGAGWSSLANWNDNAGKFSTSGSVSPTPTPSVTPTPSPIPTGTPTPGAVEVWWPTDGVHVSGNQTFKAMLENLPISQYNMFWQVDGDHLNPMYDSQTDYPHKEYLADLSGWNWKGAGPYLVNFIAKDLGGSTLSQKSVDLFTGTP